MTRLARRGPGLERIWAAVAALLVAGAAGPALAESPPIDCAAGANALLHTVLSLAGVAS